MHRLDKRRLQSAKRRKKRRFCNLRRLPDRRPRTKGKKLFFTRRRVVSQRRKKRKRRRPFKNHGSCGPCDGRGNRKCYREKHRNKVDKRPLCRRQKGVRNSLRKHFGGFFPPFAGDNRYRNKRFAAAGRLPRRHKKKSGSLV